LAEARARWWASQSSIWARIGGGAILPDNQSGDGVAAADVGLDGVEIVDEAHWCTLPTGRLAVRDARLPLPASRRDGPGRSPYDSLRETRRAAGAGRMKRATG
jgi:hypothetical protein